MFLMLIGMSAVAMSFTTVDKPETTVVSHYADGTYSLTTLNDGLDCYLSGWENGLGEWAWIAIGDDC